MILDAASAVIAQNRNRKEKRLYTERHGRRARSCTTAPATTSTRPSSSPARARTALHDDAENTVAVLYRTNAQSRTLEDALRRAGIAYKIIGGVRFYERKEIKDALAYLRLVLNPHDDVSLRRVINVPARGIGKGVMESLEARRAADRRRPAAAARRPAAGRRPTTRCGRGWCTRVDQRLLAPRAVASLAAFRDLLVELTAIAAAGVGVDRARQGARPERLPAGSARGAQRGGRGPHREPDGARLGGARVRDAAAPEPSLGGFVDQLSLLSDVDEEAGSTRRARADDDDAQRQGARVPGRHHRRPRGRPVSRTRARPTTRRSSRRSGGSATSA